MSLFTKVLLWKCLLQVGVQGSNFTLTCPKGYLVEGMVSYNRPEVTGAGFFVCTLCYRDSAVFDAIEYCIDKDFTKDVWFFESGLKSEFRKNEYRKVKKKVERHTV